MELQGTLEVVLNLRTCLELHLPDGRLLSLIAEKRKGDHRMDDYPMLGPPEYPLVEHLRAGRRELGDLVGGARRSSRVDVSRIPVFPAAVR
jgi:hypothetical protein